MHKYENIHSYIYTIYTCTHPYVHICKYIYIYAYTYIHVYVYIYIDTYIYIDMYCDPHRVLGAPQSTASLCVSLDVQIP